MAEMVEGAMLFQPITKSQPKPLFGAPQLSLYDIYSVRCQAK